MDINMQDHKPLREVVYDELKRRIMTGQIPPGTRMMEIELSESFGVSRTPIREAIRKLEKEGLATIEPRRGAYASLISVDDMIGVLVVRADLEGLAAELASQNMTDEEYQEIVKINDAYEQAIKDNDTDSIIAHDEAFHKAVVAASKNSALVQLGGEAQSMALRFRYLYYEDFSRYKNMPNEHQAIIDAIRSGNARRAREVASAHVSRLKEFVIKEGETGFKDSFGEVE